MTQTFFTSDLHFSHKTVAKLRGFTEPPVKCDEPEHFNPCNLCAPGDTVAHDAAVIANWNSVVRPEDFVWVLGDVGMGHVERFADSLIRLNGRLHLITGNHDDPWPGNRDSFKFQRNWLDYFESVQAFARRRVDGKVVLLSHFPYDGDHTDDPRATQFRLRDEGEILPHCQREVRVTAPPLTRHNLDKMTCSREKCQNTSCTGELAFHSACHESFPTWAVYRDGILIIKCSICDRAIAQVAVREE
jgi:calcineurin-like phosphoesterase family protein